MFMFDVALLVLLSIICARCELRMVIPHGHGYIFIYDLQTQQVLVYLEYYIRALKYLITLDVHVVLLLVYANVYSY